MSAPPPPRSARGDADDDADDELDALSMGRDYYALLGVGRGASGDEIRARFRALSRAFHPDRLQKHQDPRLVAVANTQYPALDRAYKVLSDPARRRVYDLYGERGLQALDQHQQQQHSTALGDFLAPPEDMQREVERVLRRMNQQALEAQFASFSELSMGVDASDLVAAPLAGLRGLLRGDRRRVARTDMTIHQRTTFPLSRTTRLTLGGYMYDKQGLGLGCLTTRLEYTSPTPALPSVALYSELGWTPKLHCQVTQPVSPFTVVMCIPELDAHGLDMSIGVNQLLAPQLHGAMMWSTRDGLSGSLSNDTQLGHHSLGLAVGRQGPGLTLQLRRTLVSAATTLKATLRASLAAGASLALGASRQVSFRTRLAMGVLVARAGVTLRLGFTRGPVRFVVPIFLSPFSAQSAFATFCAATTPVVVSAVVAQLVRPAQERRRRRDRERRRELRAHYLTSARRAALAQQELMARGAADKRAREEQQAPRGLVVLLARYGKDPTNPDPVDHARRQRLRQRRRRRLGGDGPHDDDDEADADATDRDGNGTGDAGSAAPSTGPATAMADGDEDPATLCHQWLDVTVPMQFFVQDSTVTLPMASKASLLGFYNPLAGGGSGDGDEEDGDRTPPQLYVRYAYDGRVFEATFDDHQSVQLPSRYAQDMGPVGAVH